MDEHKEIVKKILKLICKKEFIEASKIMVKTKLTDLDIQLINMLVDIQTELEELEANVTESQRV